MGKAMKSAMHASLMTKDEGRENCTPSFGRQTSRSLIVCLSFVLFFHDDIEHVWERLVE